MCVCVCVCLCCVCSHVIINSPLCAFQCFPSHLLSFSETGEQGGDQRHRSGPSSDPPLCWVSPDRVPVHTHSPTPGHRGEVPRQRGVSCPGDSPRYGRRRLAAQPPKQRVTQQVGASRFKIITPTPFQ